MVAFHHEVRAVFRIGRVRDHLAVIAPVLKQLPNEVPEAGNTAAPAIVGTGDDPPGDDRTGIRNFNQQAEYAHGIRKQPEPLRILFRVKRLGLVFPAPPVGEVKHTAMIRVQIPAMKVLASRALDDLAPKQPIPSASRQRRKHAGRGGSHLESVDTIPILGLEHEVGV